MEFNAEAVTRAQERTAKTGIFLNHEDLIPVLAALFNNMSQEEQLKVYNEYGNNTLPAVAYARGYVQDEDYVNDTANRYRFAEDILFDSMAQEFFSHDFNYEERLGGMELNDKARELINFANRRFAITALGSGDVLDPETRNYPTDEIHLGGGYDNTHEDDNVPGGNELSGNANAA